MLFLGQVHRGALFPMFVQTESYARRSEGVTGTGLSKADALQWLGRAFKKVCGRDTACLPTPTQSPGSGERTQGPAPRSPKQHPHPRRLLFSVTIQRWRGRPDQGGVPWQ